MPKMDKLGKTATSIRVENGKTFVRYHDTDVVTFDSKSIVLNTGGWRSFTTKARMNQASNQFDLGYSIYQCRGEWYVARLGILPVRWGRETSIFKIKRNESARIRRKQ